VQTYPGGSALVTFLTMPKVIWSYILLNFAPIGLTPFRHISFVNQFYSLWFILPVLGIIALIYLIYKVPKNLKFLAGWFLITLIPFLNITPLQTIRADRYAYLSSVAIIALIPIFLKKYKKVMYGIVIIFIGLTIFNNTFWQDDFTLMKRGIELNPESSKANNNLGNYYFHRGDYEKANEYFETAVRSDEKNEKAWINLGVLYSKLEDYNASIKALSNAISINDENYVAYEKLAITYMRIDDYNTSEKLFLKSIELNKNYYRSYARLGALYANMGDAKKALTYLLTAIEMNPKFAEAHFNTGLVLENIGKPNEAKTYYINAARLQPTNPQYVSKINN